VVLAAAFLVSRADLGPSADCAVGIYVLSAPSREDADALAATDPLAQGDQAGIEVIEWDNHQILRIGSLDPPLVL
jgi:hypothetical protein